MAKATQAYQKRDLYTEVTSRILKELETGAAPWIKPWSNSPGLAHSSAQKGCGLRSSSTIALCEFSKR